MKDLKINKIKNVSLAMAFALTLSMAMAGCSESDNSVNNVVQPTGRITVSAGINVGDLTGQVLKFTSGDKLYVYGKITEDVVVAGFLDIDGRSINDAGTSADFSGQVNAYDAQGTPIDYALGSDPLAACTNKTAMAMLIHAGVSTSNQTEDAIYIVEGKAPQFTVNNAVADDVETLITKCLPVAGSYDSDTKSFVLNGSTPIFNCSFSGLENDTKYHFSLYQKRGKYEAEYINLAGAGFFTTDGSGAKSFAFASGYDGEFLWKIVIKSADEQTEIGTIDLGTRDITEKVYDVTCRFVNLANVSGPTTLQDGDIAIGTLADNVKISIAADATVTLSGVNINDQKAWIAGENAGLTCLGNATIILADGTTNTVKGFGDIVNEYPGILAAHNRNSSDPADEYTLTIKGTGELNATGANHSAGIGGGYYVPCGNITIENGTIRAQNSTCGDAAAIGSGPNSSCGTITFSGGHVTAESVGDGAAIGIGYNETTGTNGSCTKIQINDTMKGVTMIKSNVDKDTKAGVFMNAQSVFIGSQDLKNYPIGENSGNALDLPASELADILWSTNPVIGSLYTATETTGVWSIYKKGEDDD